MKKAILFFLIPVFITILSVFAITSSKEAETVKLPAAYGPGSGYQQEAEQWTITASSHYKWNHGTSPGWLWILGILCFAAAGYYIYWIDKEIKGSTWVVIAFFWLAGAGCIFGKHVIKYYKSGTYSKTVSKEVYEANKGNLDAIFEQDVEKAKQLSRVWIKDYSKPLQIRKITDEERFIWNVIWLGNSAYPTLPDIDYEVCL